ncbi:pyrroline-5-carboxylate reductase [Colletotrichum gloeosporioides Cg-14]|uniref:Pyrroline-5-carboxylate reductase n=1 Tax=Colletotrichum gloeosporioides (strain Cg-14) TaxID=1237896 RepID=T0K5Z8_COLGC|nr:pyrroline-5-carboxylate reductase [Colletotrichum gloeosporioides Cg-14]
MVTEKQTISFIGCGSMGSALLRGLLDSCASPNPEVPKPDEFHFIACTKTSRSAGMLSESLGEDASRVKITHGEPVKAAEAGGIVILGFKPYMAAGVFDTPGFLDALEGKLVVSMLAGLTVEELNQLASSNGVGMKSKRCIHFTRALPTVACRYRQSMTVLEIPDNLPDQETHVLKSIFSRVGKLRILPPDLMNVGSMLVTACLATISVPLDGLLDGAVAEGLKRSEARDLVVQGLQGLVSVLENGEQTALIREAISSPRGGTIQSLITVEKAGTRGTFAEAVINGSRQFSKPR